VDFLTEATRRLAEARDEVAELEREAAQRIGQARQREKTARAELAVAIVAAARQGMRQRDIVATTGYTREWVRHLCREAGL
jgi:cytochrome c-type biogenesis protein CcmH/NrfG